MHENNPAPLVELRSVTKKYSGVTALEAVDFSVRPGEAVCLAGENGSGKSTLIKIISGVEPASGGSIFFNGNEYPKITPRLAASMGVMVIFQDFSLFPNLSVAENIAFGSLLSSGLKVFDRSKTVLIAQKALDQIGVDIDLETRVENLSVAQKQLVAVCRALASKARLIIMDEPTTALTQKEVRRLQDIIQMLKLNGVAVIFVSHKLSEVLEVSEKVFVLRNGKKVAEGPASDFDTTKLTYHMTGRDVSFSDPGSLSKDAATLMEVSSLTKHGAFADINFNLRAGEVLGITGLLGSGRTSVAKAIFGLVEPDSGSIRVDGEKLELGDPQKSAAAGIGYVPEDRLTEGLFLTQSIMRNVAIGRLDSHTSGYILNIVSLLDEAQSWLKKLSVKAPNVDAPVQSLSGGNQQRVALARWLARSPRILILNGPSVGVDVGSKAEIHEIIRTLSASGIGILVISDDLPELLSTCHRILVMRDGSIIDSFDRNNVNEGDLAQRLAS